MAIPNFFRSDQWVKTTLGLAIPGAHVYWLSQPTSNVPQSEALGPPAPLATIYTDSTGGTQASQPVTTDGFGHAATYLAPGIYTVLVYNNGSLQEILPDQNVGAAGAVSGVVSSINGLTGTPSITAGANVTVTVSGSSIQIASSGGGGGGTTLNFATITLTPTQIRAWGAGGNTLVVAGVVGKSIIPLGCTYVLGNYTHAWTASNASIGLHTDPTNINLPWNDVSFGPFRNSSPGTTIANGNNIGSTGGESNGSIVGLGLYVIGGGWQTDTLSDGPVTVNVWYVLL